jgi:hypothetical protein
LLRDDCPKNLGGEKTLIIFSGFNFTAGLWRVAGAGVLQNMTPWTPD